jgi:hypothetical protein
MKKTLSTFMFAATLVTLAMPFAFAAADAGYASNSGAQTSRVASDTASQSVTGTVTKIDKNASSMTVRDDASGTERTLTCSTLDPNLKAGDKITATVSGNEATSVSKA